MPNDWRALPFIMKKFPVVNKNKCSYNEDERILIEIREVRETDA